MKMAILAVLVAAAVYLWHGVLAAPVQVDASPVVPEFTFPVKPPEPVPEPEPLRVPLNRITYYQAVPEQTDDDPFTSSCGRNRPNQVAVSRDLMNTIVKCGSIIQAWSDTEGYLGEYVVWDVTNARFTDTLDILVRNPPTWGKTTGYMTVKETP
jgi:hypothetical protein